MAKGRRGKIGAPDHFSGFKLAFLVSKSALYQQSLDSNAVAGFYDQVTVEFIAKYGRDEPFNKEPAEDPPDQGGVVDDPEPLSNEEAAQKAAVFAKLRTKLAQWYRRKYKRVEDTKSNHSSTNPYLTVLAANIEKAPRKRTPFHQYLKDHYRSHVKEEYQRRYELAKERYDNATEEERTRENMTKPVAFNMRIEIGRQFWLLESQEFRDTVAQTAEEAHKKEVEDWEASKTIPRTPQQFHQQLAFAGHYLHPVAKAIASQMQAAVSICIIGPVPDRNGEVEVRSVHMNWPGGIEGATWPLHDPTGYSEAEKSMASYGRTMFSAAECHRRALPLQTQDVDELDTNCNAEQEVPSPRSRMDSPPRLDSPRGELPQVRPAQLAPPSATTTSPEEGPNAAYPPQRNPSLPNETSIPIDPVLLALSSSHLQVAEPVPQPEPRRESPQPQQWGRAAANPESDSEEAPNINGNDSADPVLSPVAPTRTPAYNFSTLTSRVVVHPPIPSNLPKHMVDAYRYLTEETTGIGKTAKRNWGDKWLRCLHAFIDFQRSEGFPEGGPSFSPSIDVRPREIAVWMKSGRRWKDVELADEERFGQQWWDWWRSLQPESRIVNVNHQNRIISPTCDMDWSDLRKPGKNGFLLIVISLTWWGKASTREGSWLEAVVDVTEVLLYLRGAGGSKAPKVNLPGVPSTGNAASASSFTPRRGRRGHGGGTAAGRPSKKRKVR